MWGLIFYLNEGPADQEISKESQSVFPENGSPDAWDVRKENGHLASLRMGFSNDVDHSPKMKPR